MKPTLIEWIWRLDNGGQLGALLMLLLFPITLAWLIGDLVCQRFSLGTWQGWVWNGWRKPGSRV